MFLCVCYKNCTVLNWFLKCVLQNVQNWFLLILDETFAKTIQKQEKPRVLDIFSLFYNKKQWFFIFLSRFCEGLMIFQLKWKNCIYENTPNKQMKSIIIVEISRFEMLLLGANLLFEKILKSEIPLSSCSKKLKKYKKQKNKILLFCLFLVK